MRRHLAAVVITLGTTVLVLGSALVLADDKPKPIEAFTTVAASMQRGRASRLDIVITRWSTDEERERLLTTLQEFGRDKLVDELTKIRPTCGYMRTPQTKGWDLFYCRNNVMPDGSRHVVIATDRYVTFAEAATSQRSMQYQVTLIELHLDKDGKGEGKMVPAAKITWDKEKKKLEIENYSALPIDLKGVKPQKV